MKKINIKITVITSLICLLPIILGIALYNRLSPQIAIHFDINNNPDNYVSKNLAVFGLPVLMTLLQIFCCIISDINSAYKGSQPKIEWILKGIIPAITVILYISTIIYDLQKDLDIRRIACFIVGTIFILIGNYIPKINYGPTVGIHLTNLIKNEFIWKKVNRIIGYSFVILGILFIISLLLPPVFSVICLLFIPVISIAIFIYSIYLIKTYKKK